jgi:AraC-like DNA-binding protein
MTTSVEPTQSSRALRDGGMWIEGTLAVPPEGVSGPLVFGADWLLEMLRTQDGHSLGFFWAPFAIVHDFPKVEGIFGGRFVGFSLPAEPPASWLTTSMVFDLGDVPLAATPEEFVALVRHPRPYVPMERTGPISPLSQRARKLIASSYRSDLSIRDVARQLHVSHAHLARQFKRDFGLTPLNYLHRLRVSEAMGKLSKGEPPLEVGYEVGFNDTSRFYSDFLKVTGTSPGKCRKSLM